MITLIVPGKPAGKARPRFKPGQLPYKPAETKQAEGNVRAAWYGAGCPIIEGRPPLVVTVSIVLRRPEGHWKKDGTLSAAGLRVPLPTRKPDVDNALKLQLDALNGAAYEDDVQVVDARVLKRWAAPGEVEHTRIDISEAKWS